MHRSTLVFTLLWALLVLPAVCTAGFVLHPCDCGSTAWCEHEGDCASDPCDAGLVRPEADEVSAAPSLSLALALPTLPPSAIDPVFRVPDCRECARAPHVALPFPLSDRPLRN